MHQSAYSLQHSVRSPHTRMLDSAGACMPCGRACYQQQVLRIWHRLLASPAHACSGTHASATWCTWQAKWADTSHTLPQPLTACKPLLCVTIIY
jgi:hypothetical protein